MAYDIVSPLNYKDPKDFIRSFARVVSGKPALPRTADDIRAINLEIFPEPTHEPGRWFPHEKLSSALKKYMFEHKFKAEYRLAETSIDASGLISISNSLFGYGAGGGLRRKPIWTGISTISYTGLMDELARTDVHILDWFITQLQRRLHEKNFAAKTRK
jgi:hypothetical protein